LRGRRQKILPINRWLYTHKRRGMFMRKDKKTNKKIHKKTSPQLTLSPKTLHKKPLVPIIPILAATHVAILTI
jgi:hypothetical protein